MIFVPPNPPRSRIPDIRGTLVSAGLARLSKPTEAADIRQTKPFAHRDSPEDLRARDSRSRTERARLRRELAPLADPAAAVRLSLGAGPRRLRPEQAAGGGVRRGLATLGWPVRAAIHPAVGCRSSGGRLGGRAGYRLSHEHPADLGLTPEPGDGYSPIAFSCRSRAALDWSASSAARVRPSNTAV